MNNVPTASVVFAAVILDVIDENTCADARGFFRNPSISGEVARCKELSSFFIA
jgi:hypothetical protein